MDAQTRQLIDNLKINIENSLQNLNLADSSVKRTNIMQTATQYLDHAQGQREIYDYKIVCDASNNPPSVANDPERSLMQGILDSEKDDFIIEFDEHEYKLFYRDTLYRVFDKRIQKITSFFEENEIHPLPDQSLNIDVFIKPIVSVESILLKIKV